MILIQHIKKIKGHKQLKELLVEIFFYSVFLAVSFFLIYWKVDEGRAKPLILDSQNTAMKHSVSQQVSEVHEDAKYVASSRGKYFYEIGSKRANSLSEKNKIYFNDPEEAKKLGFKPYFDD